MLEYAMPQAWADKMREWLDKDEAQTNGEKERAADELRVKIAHVSEKLQRLLDSFLEQDIEREIYVEKKAELMSEKKSLEEKRSAILLGKERRLEPIRKWIETAVSICKIAKSDDLAAKKSLLLEILGLNLKMENKKVGLAAEQFQISPLKPRWQALRAASEKAAHAGGNFGNSSFLVAPTGLEPVTQGSSGLCSTS